MGPIRRSLLLHAALIFSVVVAIAISCPEVSAQGWLAGASVGTAKQYDYEVGGTIDSSDDTDTGYRVFGGYLFMPVLGVVVSYADLGTMNYAGPSFGGFTDELSANAVDMSVLGGWAPGSQKRFSLFGTAGFFHFNQDVHYVDASGTYNYDDSGWSFSYGAGAEVTLGAAAKWGIHFNYQMFTDVGDADNSGHEYDRSLIALGFDYRFGK